MQCNEYWFIAVGKKSGKFQNRFSRQDDFGTGVVVRQNPGGQCKTVSVGSHERKFRSTHD